jgi:hypothetical protein
MSFCFTIMKLRQVGNEEPWKVYFSFQKDRCMEYVNSKQV